jgi:4-hydroxyphenylacetate 3-hydroxylase, reductase component
MTTSNASPIDNDGVVALRRCLSQFATGVTVVTTKANGFSTGLTVNSFSSVSLSPPLVQWSIKRSSQSFDTFSNARHFAVNILSSSQVEISQHFGRSGGEKLGEIPHVASRNGMPILEGTIASLECEKVAQYDGGDHVIVVGKVIDFTRSDGPPLLFAQGRYGIVIDHPGTQQIVEMPREAGGPLDQLTSALMWRAYGAMSVPLSKAREEEQLELIELRLLAAIQTFSGATLDEMLPKLYLGRNAAEQMLLQVVARGFVLAGAGGELTLTASGALHISAMLDRVAKIEQDFFAGISDADMRTMRRILATVINRRDKS